MRRLTGWLLVLSVSSLSPAQAPPSQKPPPPRLVMTSPLVVEPGGTRKLTLRGLHLEGATEVRVHEPRCRGKLLGQFAKVGVPKNEWLDLYGDQTQVIELTLPDDLTAREIALSVITLGGESNAQRLLLDDGQPQRAEKEPNNGFKEAQALSFPLNVDGVIQNPQDVDTFRFDAQAGQTYSFAILARRYGSPLDAILTLYDTTGQVLASCDDADGADPRLRFRATRAGTHYLTVTDAHDLGGPEHRYRLTCRQSR